MEDNKDGFPDVTGGISSEDFNYDAYTGGSSSSGSGVTSGDFNYDVYSGSSAMEYLRQENERKHEEKVRASKSAAELKREEYEKKFAGMSADELFGMPEKKKKPEDDFSDFFDADEIERQREKLREFENEKKPDIKIETMMPGEDTPSSQQPDQRYKDGVTEINALLASQRIRREKRDEYYRSTGKRRYRRAYRRGYYSYYPLAYLFSYIFSGSSDTELPERIGCYTTWGMLGALIIVIVRRFTKAVTLPILFLVSAAMAGIGAVVTPMIRDGDSLSEAISERIVELIITGVLLIIGTVLALVA